MSLVTNLQSAFTRVATEFKTIRTFISGSGTGDTSGLSTTSKNLVGAVNEVKALVGQAVPHTLDDLTDVTASAPAQSDILMYDATNHVWVNISGYGTFMSGGAGLDALSDVTLSGVSPGQIMVYDGNAGQWKNFDGSNFFQPRDPDLDNLAATGSTPFGRNVLTTSDAAALRALLALGYFATGTDAGQLTGTLPTSVIPALAISDVFQVANQAAMLALNAQRGDVAVRTDTGSSYILSADTPSTLSAWIEMPAIGKITSVNGQQGVVVLSKSDVGLSNVDNVKQQPYSNALAQLAGLGVPANQIIVGGGSDTFFATYLDPWVRTNLLGAADAATARSALGVYGTNDIGDPNTNFVAVFEAGLA
jgi:hypothetical protein